MRPLKGTCVFVATVIMTCMEKPLMTASVTSHVQPNHAIVRHTCECIQPEAQLVNSNFTVQRLDGCFVKSVFQPFLEKVMEKNELSLTLSQVFNLTDFI